MKWMLLIGLLLAGCITPSNIEKPSASAVLINNTTDIPSGCPRGYTYLPDNPGGQKCWPDGLMNEAPPPARKTIEFINGSRITCRNYNGGECDAAFVSNSAFTLGVGRGGGAGGEYCANIDGSPCEIPQPKCKRGVMRVCMYDNGTIVSSKIEEVES